MALGALAREENRKWRRQDVASWPARAAKTRGGWNRYVEKNRRDVEEKGEQLRTTSNLSALISGFVVVALVEFQFSDAPGAGAATERAAHRKTRRRRRAPSS